MYSCFFFCFFVIVLSNVWINITSWEKHMMKILLGCFAQQLLLIRMLQEILSLTDTTHCFITLERGHLDNSCQEVKEMTPWSLSICHKYEHVQVDGDYKLQWCNSSTFSPSLWKYRLWKYCFEWSLVKKSWLMEKFRLKEGFSLRK